MTSKLKEWISILLQVITLIAVLYIMFAPAKYYGVGSAVFELNENIETMERLLILQDSLSSQIIAPNITRIENHYHTINGIRRIEDPDSLVNSINAILK